MVSLDALLYLETGLILGWLGTVICSAYRRRRILRDNLREDGEAIKLISGRLRSLVTAVEGRSDWLTTGMLDVVKKMLAANASMPSNVEKLGAIDVAAAAAYERELRDGLGAVRSTLDCLEYVIAPQAHFQAELIAGVVAEAVVWREQLARRVARSADLGFDLANEADFLEMLERGLADIDAAARTDPFAAGPRLTVVLSSLNLIFASIELKTAHLPPS